MAMVLILSVLGPCLAEEEKGILGRLTKLGVSEDVINAEIKECFFDYSPFSRFQYFDDLNSMIMALTSGSIMGMGIDEYMAGFLNSRIGGFTDYRDDIIPMHKINCSMLLRAEDAELCDRISAIIADMEADGTLESPLSSGRNPATITIAKEPMLRISPREPL